MPKPSSLPFIPPEALARQARMEQLLKDMIGVAPSLEAPSVQQLRSALIGQHSLDVEAWATRVQAEQLVEEAAEWVRSTHRAFRDSNLLKRVEAVLDPLAAKAQVKRAAFHHLDSRRTTIRFRFSKQAPAVELDDRDLQALFLQAFRLEGLVVALDLGKRPRPQLRSQLPLPAGIAGMDECMDVELKREPVDPEGNLLRRLETRLPEGLAIHHWEAIPNHASGVAERALVAHWRWLCPPPLAGPTQEMAGAFQSSGEGREGCFQSMVWEAGALDFTTRLGPYAATNPAKILAGRLGVNPGDVTGVVRLRVDLRPDTRLDQAGRFEAKLKNIYEDAVLLGSGSNITLVDDEDDEPLRLG